MVVAGSGDTMAAIEKCSYGFNYGYGTYAQLVSTKTRRGPFWANPAIRPT